MPHGSSAAPHDISLVFIELGALIIGLAHRRISLLSGVDFSVDTSLGLNGICDYIVALSEQQYFVEVPVLLLVEAKNEDIKRGCGQCFAEMIPAQKFNDREAVSARASKTVCGVVTIGERWKFLQLDEANAFIDAADYYLKEIHKIMAILLHLTVPAPTLTA